MTNSTRPPDKTNSAGAARGQSAPRQKRAAANPGSAAASTAKRGAGKVPEPVITSSSLEKRTMTATDGAEAAAASHPRRGAHSREERHRLIAHAAYFRSEYRGFAPGYELEDWLWAERELDGASEGAGAGRELDGGAGPGRDRVTRER
ncbi:MAG TPA: DUF2934 domain-containing protein [Steroidobacteraceae bacterium]|nr:DUF2934 domain-containing protein [Steroidobacteraceae bacterium]